MRGPRGGLARMMGPVVLVEFGFSVDDMLCSSSKKGREGTQQQFSLLSSTLHVPST